MAKKEIYNNESITMLKGPDKVRKRPGVIFGSDGIDGCVSAFVYNSITPETSEKGDIFFKIISNTIIRVA